MIAIAIAITKKAEAFFIECLPPQNNYNIAETPLILTKKKALLWPRAAIIAILDSDASVKWTMKMGPGERNSEIGRNLNRIEIFAIIS